MATEKATDTTATQNPAPKAPAKARTTRARTSTAAQDAAATATNAASKPRAKSTRSATSNATPAGAERAENAAAERSLLEKEASKSLQPHAKPACKAHCGQCGREMRFVPFTLSNLMCRSCYGLDRYRRPTSPSLSSLTASRPSGPR